MRKQDRERITREGAEGEEGEERSAMNERDRTEILRRIVAPIERK